MLLMPLLGSSVRLSPQGGRVEGREQQVADGIHALSQTERHRGGALPILFLPSAWDKGRRSAVCRRDQL